YFAVRFLKLIIVKMYITHVAGCFFYYLATTMPQQDQGFMPLRASNEAASSHRLASPLPLSVSLLPAAPPPTRLQRDIRLSYFAVRFLKLIIVEMYITHVAGCFFYYLATTMPPQDQGYTWIGSLTLGDFSYENFREVDLFTRYVTALYWSVVTMATIGYGDIHPVNPREMIFAMFYITVDLILSAYLIGNITALVVKGSNTTKYRERMAQVIKYMNRNRIPRVLRHQMRQHVRLQFETDQVEDNILNDFPVSIRHKVARALYRRLVEQSYIFQGCSPEFINQIVTKVTPEHYFPSEVVLQHRDSPERLYIICAGSVEETSPSSSADGGRRFSELGTGSMFGEVAVLCNIPQPFDVSVIEFCQVLRLERDDLNTAIATFMVDGRKIVDNLLERTTETGSKYALLASEITSLIAQQEAELTMTTIYAASRGDVEHLKKLIKAGANASKADYDGRTPLHLAAAGGYDEVVRFLLLEGADVNSLDNFGTTPLLEALRAGNDSTAKILTDKHGTVNLQEAGTDLCNAVMRGDTGLLRRLLVNGVNPNAADYDLRTPLHIASAEGFVQVARLLVEHGADVAALDRWGNSPLDEARRCGSLPLIHLLEEAMRERGLVIGGGSIEDAQLPSTRPPPIPNSHSLTHSQPSPLLCPADADWDRITEDGSATPRIAMSGSATPLLSGPGTPQRRGPGTSPGRAQWRPPAGGGGVRRTGGRAGGMGYGGGAGAAGSAGGAGMGRLVPLGPKRITVFPFPPWELKPQRVGQLMPLPPSIPDLLSTASSIFGASFVARPVPPRPKPQLPTDPARLNDSQASPTLDSSTSAAGTLSREGDGSFQPQADVPLLPGGNKLPFSSRIPPPPLPRRPAATHRLRRLRKRTANGTFYLSDELADITEVWSSSILLRPPAESNGGDAPSGNSPLSPPPPGSGNIEAPTSSGEEESGEDSVASESGSGVATSSVVSELAARVAREPVETVESLDLSRVLETEVGPNGVLTEGVASAVLVDLSRAGKSRHALKLFDWLKARAFLLSTSAHTALIAALARSGPYADAARVLAGMRAAGLAPTVHACTAAMQAQSRGGRWRAALLLLEEMRGMGLKPDTMAYNAVLTACGRAGRVQEVLAVYQAMQDDECRPSTGTRALLMSTFVRADRCDLALQLFFDARLAGQPVTPDMHRGLICVASKRFFDALLAGQPVTPDMCRGLICVASKSQPLQLGAAATLRCQAASQPVTPDMHRGLICVASKVGCWPLTLDQLDDFLATFDPCWLTTSTSPRPPPLPHWHLALDLLDDLLAVSDRCGLTTFQQPFLTCPCSPYPSPYPSLPGGSLASRSRPARRSPCHVDRPGGHGQDEGPAAAAAAAAAGGGRPRSSDAGSGERWEKGSAWGEVLGAPNSALPFNALISSLARAGQWQLALSVFSQMKTLGIRPDHFTWSGLASALARAGEFDRAMALFEHMGEREGLQPTLVVCNCALLACQHKAKWQRALQLLWRMERMGVQADVRSYSMVIRTCELAGGWLSALSHGCALLACQHKAKWQRALQLLWRMERMGVQADVWSYSMVILCLSRPVRCCPDGCCLSKDAQCRLQAQYLHSCITQPRALFCCFPHLGFHVSSPLQANPRQP
ncbi:unnamed protein product, partial [Closterium sp. Yama58-4]